MNKKKLLLSVTGLALLGGGAYFGLAYSLPLLTSQLIRQNGFPAARVQNLYVTPTGLLIDHISLDSNDFSTIDTITITMNWWGFIKDRKIKAVSVKDISLTAELDDAGHFKIAGWDATLPQSDGGSSLIPIESLLLQGVTVDMDTPQGDIRIEGKLSVENSGPNDQTLQYSVWGQQHQLSFDTTGSGKLSSNGDITLKTTLNEGRLNLPNVELSRASGELTYQKLSDKVAVLTGKLIAGKINTMGALLQNVNVNFDTSQLEALYFKTSPAGYKDITLTGRWLTGKFNKLELTIDSKNSMDVVELLAPDKKNNFKSLLKGIDPLFASIEIPVSSLQNDKKSAKFKIEAGDKKSPAHKIFGDATYDTTTLKSSISLNTLELSIAGGRVYTFEPNAPPITFDPMNLGDSDLSFYLHVDSVDMSKLADLAEVNGLKAKGTLTGMIPVTYNEKGIGLGTSILNNMGPGTFSYTPEQFPPSLQGDDERMKTVRETLSDFRFSKFSVNMNGYLDDKMKTTLTAEGVNPAFGERPIHLNLKLDGDIGPVLKQILKTVDFTEQIKSEIEKKKK